MIAAARLLRLRPAHLRPWCLARLLAEAEAADRRALSGGGRHPQWGDGSLMTAALRRGSLPDFGPSDSDYCRCLALVALALAERDEPREAVRLG